MYSLSILCIRNGTQEMPASVMATRSSGYLTGTPVVIMCTMFAIIEKVWLQICRPNSVSKPWVLKGKTGWITVTLCMSTGRSASWAAS
jgi:hypothetical protein